MDSIEKQIRDLFHSEQHKLTPLSAKNNHTLATVGEREELRRAIAPTRRFIIRRKPR